MSDTSESQYLAVIRVWAALAWADDVIQESERAAILKLVAVAQLTDEERETAKGMLESKVELETQPIAALSQPAREGIYRAALRLAMVDLDMAEEETAMLKLLRDGLSISEDDSARIAASIA